MVLCLLRLQRKLARFLPKSLWIAEHDATRNELRLTFC